MTLSIPGFNYDSWGGGFDSSRLYETFGERVADLPGFGTNWGSNIDLAERQYDQRVQQAFQASQQPAAAPPPAQPPASTDPGAAPNAPVLDGAPTEFNGDSFAVSVNQNDTQWDVVKRGLETLADRVPLSDEGKKQFVDYWTANLQSANQTTLYHLNQPVSAEEFSQIKAEQSFTFYFTPDRVPKIVTDLQSRLALEHAETETISVTSSAPRIDARPDERYSAAQGFNATDYQRWAATQRFAAQATQGQAGESQKREDERLPTGAGAGGGVALTGRETEAESGWLPRWPNGEQVTQTASQLIEDAVQMLDAAGKTWADDNVPDSWKTKEAREDVRQAQAASPVGTAIGHAGALAQSVLETTAGTGMMTGGAAEMAAGVGLVPVAVAGGPIGVAVDVGLVVKGAVTAAAGTALTGHGVFVGVNTINHILEDPNVYAKGAGSESGSEVKQPGNTVSGRRDLEAHEATAEEPALGHTVERHVGKSENWLKQRLEENPGLTKASSFRNEEIANRVQGRFVKRHRAEIDAWLKSGEDTFRGTIDMGEHVGTVVERGKKGSHVTTQTSKATLILRRDDSPQGWHFHTSFPSK
jgi:hypothetical protein